MRYSFWQRCRLWLAEACIIGTGLELVSSERLDDARTGVWRLAQYVSKAGGFSSPRRIQAKQRTQLGLDLIDDSLGRARQVHID